MKTPRSKRSSLCILLLALCGCAAELDTPLPLEQTFDGVAGGSADVGIVEQGLYGNAGYYWPTSGGSPVTIPVCWENASPENAIERGWMRATAERTWQRYARVNFTGWGSCGPQQSAVHIRLEDKKIRFDGQTSAPATGIVTSSGLLTGRFLLGLPDGLRLNPSYTERGPAWCAANDAQRKRCIEAHTAHEFGHVLGFYHEEERDDYAGGTAANCAKQTYENAAPNYYGTYDLASVMSYCGQPAPETWHWTLSAGDIAGVQRVYGRRIPGSLVTPQGNCLESDAEGISNPAVVRPCSEWQNDQEWRRTSQLALDFDRCLRQPAPTSTLGTNVVSGACAGSFDNWRFENAQVRGWGGLCLELPSGNTTNGTALQAVSCGGPSAANQLWSVNGSGEIRFGSSSSSKCVTNRLASPVIWDCNMPNDQRFDFLSTGQIRPKLGAGHCLEVKATVTADPLSAEMPTSGAPVELKGCAPKPSQLWNFSGPVQHVSSGRCLEREGSTDANGTAAEVNTCNGGSNETWDYYFR